MNKPVFGLVLGGILGIFDGLSALLSSPEVSSQIVGIVIGSTFKGLIAGVLVGWFSKKVNSLPLGILFGLIVAQTANVSFYSNDFGFFPRKDQAMISVHETG